MARKRGGQLETLLAYDAPAHQQALPIMFDADLEIDNKLHLMHAWERFSYSRLG